MKFLYYSILLLFLQLGNISAQSNLMFYLNNGILSPPVIGTALTFPSQHLESIYEGSDVTVFNRTIHYFGRPLADTSSVFPISSTAVYIQNSMYGRFIFNGPSDIGIDSGLVLSTGRVAPLAASGMSPGISHPAAYTTTGNNPGPPSPVTWWANSNMSVNLPISRHTQFPELVALNNGDSIIDAVVMDFFFVPKGNSIRLEYVFASEEYPENACKSRNDVMGMFLSKPGTPGYQNIALVPGTNLPVGINTINNNGGGLCEAAQNPQYYVDNLGNNGQNVIYDGFTTVLTASAEVVPCDTYHLRIAIADGAEHNNCLFEPDTITNYGLPEYHPCRSFHDSGLFLKWGSLRSTDSLWAEARGGTANSPATPYAARGCMPGRFRLYRQHAVNAPLTIPYTLSGNAVPGVDYTPLSGTAIIPSGQSYVDVLVQPLNITNIDKQLMITILSPYNACGGTVTALDSAQLDIRQSMYLQILNNDTAICNGCNVQLLTQGDQGINYSWQPATGLNNANIANPIASPILTTTYTLTGVHPSNNCVAKDSVTITVTGTGIATLGNGKTVKLLPNPFDETLELIIEGHNNELYSLTLTDMVGKELFSLSGTVAAINQMLGDKIRKLTDGNYLAAISNKKEKAVIKLLKSNR